MPSKIFEVHRQTTHDLFTKDPGRTFVVPPYQREYSWGPDEVEELIEDLFVDTAYERPYFLGSLLFAADGGTFKVLDGQQRLTTITLLLAALRARLEQLGDKKTAGKLDDIVKAGKITASDQTPKLELQPADQSIYADLLQNAADAISLNDKKLKKRPIIRAWNKIWTWAAKLDNLPVAKDTLERLLYNTHFVQIEAAGESEAFVLFETLNDRGLDLSAADLVKNRLLSLVKADQVETFRDKWVATIGQFKQEDVIPFLRHFYIANHGFARKEELYDVIRAQLESEKKTGWHSAAARFLERLSEQSNTYVQISNPANTGAPWSPRAQQLLRRLKSYGVSGFRPVVLLVQSKKPGEVEALLDVIERATVRYSVIGRKNPNKLEKLYGDIATEIRSSPLKPADIARSKLAGVIPDDEEFQAAFVDFQVGRVTAAVRTIMAGLHQQVVGGASVPSDPDLLHVDHILARSLPKTALKNAGLSRDRALELVGTFGNLTFLLATQNKELSDKAFPEKKATYAAATGLPLTETLAALPKWEENEILARTKKLAKLAVDHWPAVKAPKLAAPAI